MVEMLRPIQQETERQKCFLKMKRKATNNDVNLASTRAQQLVFKLASKFHKREAYTPLERLAMVIQHKITIAGAEALKKEKGIS
jgi:hypothetical protein